MSTYTVWVLWTLITWFILGMLVNVASVGRERKPVTPQVAAGAAVIQLLVIAALVVALVKG